MSKSDTAESNAATYECHDCLHRVQDSGFPGSCPECGSSMRNIAVPRE